MNTYICRGYKVWSDKQACIKRVWQLLCDDTTGDNDTSTVDAGSS